jgi:hypothetical protein
MANPYDDPGQSVSLRVATVEHRPLPGQMRVNERVSTSRTRSVNQALRCLRDRPAPTYCGRMRTLNR